jgi:hypothetical protein
MARSASTQSPAAAASSARAANGERAAARLRIDEEHRRLNELLRSLTRSRDLSRIQNLLGELDALLVVHFAGEEGNEGLHQVVGEAAAHCLPNLQRLFEEHREIRARLAELRIASERLLAGPVARLEAGVTALAEALRRHEREEHDLFGEAFYTDLGGRS